MSSLSIRQLPGILQSALTREAKRLGKTKTDIVIEALEQRYSLQPLNRRRQTLHGFFGKMTKRELKKFQEVTKCFSEVDKDMW